LQQKKNIGNKTKNLRDGNDIYTFKILK
jgi:hypothetical protein